ncbi:MAG: bifunctional riboflavin kinase/FAD synthetase [Dehalococcoidia bacterium]|nr:bifunctional riboflavin kinase/FAD synthetase [Dehalococcoidia bacterium]
MSTAQELAAYAPGAPTLLTLGVFDGMHQGHLSLIRTLKQQAAERGLLPGVITFAPHPAEVVHPGKQLPLLISVAERLDLIHAAGIPLVVLLTFTPQLSQRSPEEFVRLLTRHLRMKGLILGPDFRLGRDRTGTIVMLQDLGARLGFTVESIPPYTICGHVVSSTAIRAALERGDVEKAALMLGRHFSLTGPVTTTSRRGTSLGFPTANLDIPSGRALPRNGVYATIATIPNGRFEAVTNIGHRPTFGNAERVVESHILDFTGHIYGATLTVTFIARLRDEVAFPDSESLKAQIRRDVDAARSILKEHR